MNEYLVNEKIRFPKILLIGSDGTKLGFFTPRDALQKAYNEELDLVCINTKSTPPVCKILDFSKFKYQQKIKEKEAKKKQVRIETKEIQLRPNIASNDLDVKVKKAKEELAKGNKIRVVLSFRGREFSHKELGFNTINNFVKDVSTVENAQVVKSPQLVPDSKKIEAIIAIASKKKH